ncbi:MAG: Coenzyme F420 hydrogenase/dehydrogenase, beta subunit C-terminal domain [Desulfuromonadaceae bacterium]|nr:Coenzyme F420 hydrogenase/dehydrogenase, beta subunit C-terminal domain [Desulfuromonadaceae bacterium]
MAASLDDRGHNITQIVAHSLCIGCGLCSAGCPQSTISMRWQFRRTWQPTVDVDTCTHCGDCLNICPNSPECIAQYATAASLQGVTFGLATDADYFVAYDNDPARRILSASGGVTTALTEYLLLTGAVDGVIAALPLTACAGQPHFEMRVFRSAEDLDRGRGSHYHPMNYAQVLAEVSAGPGVYAVVGVPCVLRGLVRLPQRFQEKIKYKIGLVCGRNANGAFSDCLARKEGIAADVPYRIKFRDKVGIPDANHYNNLFEFSNRWIRKSRFATAFTEMWRNYFFLPECCLYCPDFYGVDADIAIKDAWGRLSTDPLGTSLLIVNNPEIKQHLVRLKHARRLFLQSCPWEEVFDSQKATAIFKHEKVRYRIVWKKCLKGRLNINYRHLSWQERWFSLDSIDYWRKFCLMSLSNRLFARFEKVPVTLLNVLFSPLPRDVMKKIRSVGVKLKTSLMKRRH